MAISVGDKVPNSTVKKITADGPEDISTNDFFAGKKIVLIGLPGAFTGTCHNTHVPGYVEHIKALNDKGVDEVAILSVNDFFVMGAWAKVTDVDARLTFLSDGLAEFTKALGMDIDLSAPGLGIRSKRFAATVDGGVVTSVAVEENPGEVTSTGADAVLASL